jgi:O-antigen/teichoic acid export membrane protein
LAGATALAQGFVFLVAPLVTRLYSPSDFGAFGLLLGVGAVVGSVGTGRLEHAIPVAHSTANAVRVFVLGALLVAGVASVTTLVMFLLQASGFLEGTAWAGLALASIPSLAISLALFQLTSAVLLRQKSYGRVSVNKTLQGITTGTMQIVFGLLGFLSLGLVLAQTLGYLTGCLAGVRRLSGRAWTLATRGRLRLQETFHAFRKFPLVLAPAALFNQASQQAPLLAIGSIFGLQEAGLYALTQRVCGAPLALIGQAVSQVYASEFRQVRSGGGAAVARHYRILLVRLTLVGALVVSALVAALFFGDEFLFGREWANLGRVALYLVAMLISDFATTPISMTLGYLGEQRLQLLWDIGRLVAIVLVFGLVVHESLEFEQTLLLLSVVWSASLMTHAFITYRACQRHAL